MTSLDPADWRHFVDAALERGVTVKDIAKACRINTTVVIDWLTGDMVPARDVMVGYADVLADLVAATLEIEEMRRGR